MKIAQLIDLDQIQKETNPKFTFQGDDRSLGSIISKLLPYIFSIAGILMLLYLIYGGISLMISGGDPKAVQEAKSKITNAIIGFVIIFAAYWIVQILGNILGLEGTSFGSIFNLN